MHLGWSWCHARSRGGYSGHYMALGIVIGLGVEMRPNQSNWNTMILLLGLPRKKHILFSAGLKSGTNVSLECQGPPQRGWDWLHHAASREMKRNSVLMASTKLLENSCAFQLPGLINSLLKPVWVWRFSKEFWNTRELQYRVISSSSSLHSCVIYLRREVTGDTSESWHPLCCMYQEIRSPHWNSNRACLTSPLVSCSLGHRPSQESALAIPASPPETE